MLGYRRSYGQSLSKGTLKRFLFRGHFCYDIEMATLRYLAIVLATALFVYYMAKDRLRPYTETFHLQKAALVYNRSLEELRQLFLPVQRSVFWSSNVVWLYEDTA